MKIPRFCLFFIVLTGSSGWGFFAHQKINYLAVFSLPPEMILFYKPHIDYLTEAAINPDKRRFAVEGEACRHYIDLDHYGDSAILTMPKYWTEAVAKYSEDTLKAYGVVPWHIQRTFFQLKEAFLTKDPDKILRLSADLGHYIADAHVPLHTTENYNGQLTGQDGIHALWESRLPELFAEQYDFFVGRASYIANTQLAAWAAVHTAHRAVDSVLLEEKKLSEAMDNKKYSFETKGKQTVKVYAQDYAAAYHRRMDGMVERQMRRAIKTIADFWFTAWVDAGQPDLTPLMTYMPDEAELRKRREEIELWKQKNFNIRDVDHDE